MGLCFENGMGCDIDMDMAQRCYAESLKNGYRPAGDALNRLTSRPPIPQRRESPQKTDPQATTRSGIDWGAIAFGGGAFLGGLAAAVIDTFMERRKDRSNGQ